MNVIFALLGFAIHVVAVLITIQFVETQWPTLARYIKAVIVTTVVSFIIALLRGWICSWLCH